RVDPRCHFVLGAFRPPVSLDRLRLHLFRPWERACARRAFATKVAPTRRMPVEARPQTVAILEAVVPDHLPQAEPCRGREGLAAKSRRRLPPQAVAGGHSLQDPPGPGAARQHRPTTGERSEEHTSE